MKELSAIQTTLVSNKKKKNNHGGFAYRSAEDILEDVKPLLKANGCSLTMSDDVVNVGDSNYVRSTATLTNSSGESVSVSACAKEERANKMMCDPMKTGSTSSYARKYALGGLFALDDNDNVESTGYGMAVAEVALENEIASMVYRIQSITDKEKLAKVMPHLEKDKPHLLVDEVKAAYEAKVKELG